MNAILILNAGSSSIKFAVFDPADVADGPGLIAKGQIAAAGANAEWRVDGADGASLEKLSAGVTGEFDHDAALDRVFAWLDGHDRGFQVTAVGHRVVHGGEQHTAPVRVDDAVMRQLEALAPLAPLHQPHNLRPIARARERWPGVPQIACFDTAFHATQPAVARAVALPREITEAGVRRYGFHGLSYEYIATQLPRVLGSTRGGKVIVAHLGNGASLCAMAGGKSVATTMGFSALDGLMMGTRCGSLDPGVLLYLLQERGFDAGGLVDLLYHRSGLLGVSGLSSDMPVLLHSAEPQAAEAVDLFVHRIVVDIGALAAAMGGLDALVFTAGIGEHAAEIRARVCAGCAWLGADVDERANVAHGERFDTPASRLQLAVVPTDEERMIAVHTFGLIGGG